MGARAVVKGRMAPRTNTTLIGDFFETALAKLLNCRVADYGQPLYGDIYNEAQSFRVEVKARDHQHPFGLNLKQKEFYEHNNLPFPHDFSHTLYAAFMYKRDVKWSKRVRSRNGWSNHYVSSLTLLKTEQEKLELLASLTRTVWLLDIEVISALQRKLGTGMSTHPVHARDKEEQEITLWREDLEEMFCRESFAETLDDLGLCRNEWRGASRNIRLGFDFWTRDPDDEFEGSERPYSARFNLVSVLRRDFSKTLLNQLTGARTPSSL